MITASDDMELPGYIPATAAPRRRHGLFILLGDRRALVGGCLFGGIVLVSVLAPVLAPYSPSTLDFGHTLAPPSWAHLFGTDDFGRDVLSRTLYAGRPALLIATTTVAICALVGIPLGLFAGYVGGAIEMIIMRVADVLLSLPALILAIGIVGVLGPSPGNVVLALAIVYIPFVARVARGVAVTLRHTLYLSAAVCWGERRAAILLRQVFPNAFPPIMIQCVLVFSYSILLEASLSFLGLGTQASNPSWGRLLTQALSLITVAPWAGIFPGVFIVVTVLGLNLVGDSLADYFSGQGSRVVR